MVEKDSSSLVFNELLDAALTGKIDSIPKDKLSLEILLKPHVDGNSILHIIAKNNHLNQVPLEFLNRFSTLIENLDGETIIHIAAENGRLKDIPQNLITQEAIDNVTLDGQSVIHYAAAGGCLDKIPQELLTKEALSLQDDQRETPLHLAGKHGKIKNVPKEFLTHELLAIRNNLNETVVHSIAHGDNLENIPKDILTKSFLTTRDKNNGTPIGNATRVGNLKPLLPILDPSDILWTDKGNNNLLHLAAKGNCLHDIPKEFLTKELLFKKNIYADSPLDIVARNSSIVAKNSKRDILAELLPKIELAILKEFIETTLDPLAKKIMGNQYTKKKVLKEISQDNKSLEI